MWEDGRLLHHWRRGRGGTSQHTPSLSDDQTNILISFTFLLWGIEISLFLSNSPFSRHVFQAAKYQLCFCLLRQMLGKFSNIFRSDFSKTFLKVCFQMRQHLLSCVVLDIWTSHICWACWGCAGGRGVTLTARPPKSRQIMIRFGSKYQHLRGILLPAVVIAVLNKI